MPPRATIDRRIARALSGLLVLFALAACVIRLPPTAMETPPSALEPGPPAAATRDPDITVEPLPPARVVAPRISTPAEPIQTAAISTKLKPDPVDDNPNQLFGLSGRGVAALLGPANFVRRDGSAEVWQYRAGACVLDVFLYRRDTTLSVAHVNLRQRRATTQAPRRCFAKLMADRR